MEKFLEVKNEDVEMKPVLLNGTYAIMKSYTKPYASCRYTHPAVEAAIHLRNKYDIKIQDIKNITVRTYSLAVSGHDHVDIPGSYSAKMSIPYSLAAGLMFGKAGLQEFSEETVKNTNLLDLTRKVHVVPDEGLSKVFPEIQAAIVDIETGSGMVTERVDFPKGEPENPLSDQEFRDRYDALMGYANIDASISDKVFDSIYRPETTVEDIIKDL